MNYREIYNLVTEGKNEICIFGAGFLGKTICRKIVETAGGEVDFFCDNNKDYYGKKIDGLKVISLEELKTKKDDIKVFISPTHKVAKIIYDQLRALGIDADRLFYCDYLMMQEIIESAIKSGDKNALERWKDFIDEERYLSWRFKDHLGYSLDLKNPKTFNEKMQWLKLHDRKMYYSDMVDKERAKRIVEDKIGKEYVVKTLGVWDNPDSIDFSTLPSKFVLKPTHDSGGVIICKDKGSINTELIKEDLCRCIKRNHYYFGCEWPYKNVKPRIIAEILLENDGRDVLDVYKFMCFNGQPKIIQVIQNDKTSIETVDYFDMDWNLLPFTEGFPNSQCPLKKPNGFDKMVRFAEIFSKSIPFLRVDFYEVNGHVFFSEFTFYNNSGFCRFVPFEWDKRLGEMLSIGL